MSIDKKLNLTLREIERSDMLNENRYTEDEILDIIMNDSGQIEKLLRDKEYSEIIENVLASYNKVKDFTEKEIDIIRKVVSEQKEVSSK